jgi:hypothetical protein
VKNGFNKLLFPAALMVVFAVGCTNKQSETEAPVYLTADVTFQPGFINIAIPAPIQFQTITIQSHFKSPTGNDPQHFADVSLDHYTVTYARIDGGTRVPPVETFSTGTLVPSGGTSTLSNFPGMYAYAVQESPFDQLLPFNGGIDRETGKTEIDTTFTFRFYGQTLSGQRVESQPASAFVVFRYVAL